MSNPFLLHLETDIERAAATVALERYRFSLANLVLFWTRWASSWHQSVFESYQSNNHFFLNVGASPHGAKGGPHLRGGSC